MIPTAFTFQKKTTLVGAASLSLFVILLVLGAILKSEQILAGSPGFLLALAVISGYPNSIIENLGTIDLHKIVLLAYLVVSVAGLSGFLAPKLTILLNILIFYLWLIKNITRPKVNV